MITRTERMAAIAYDAFCRSITRYSEPEDHYRDAFWTSLEPDIRRAWVAAIAVVINTVEDEKKAES